MTVFPSLRDTVRRGAAIFPGQQGHSQGLSQAVSFPADDFSEKRFVLFFLIQDSSYSVLTEFF